MKCAKILLTLACVISPSYAQENADGPTNEKAQKSYAQGLEYAQRHKERNALDSFKKANKQDGGHCPACQRKIVLYAIEVRDWKAAETAAADLVAGAQGKKDLAIAHFQVATVFLHQGVNKHKDELFTQAHDELSKAISAYSNFPDAVFADGQALAYLRQDEAAKVRFQQYVEMKASDDPTAGGRCASSVAPNWFGPRWCRLSKSPLPTGSTFRLTISRVKSCSSISGPHGAPRAAMPCLT